MEGMSIRRAFWIFVIFLVLTSIADRVLFIILPLYMLDLSFSATEIGLAFSGAAAVLAVFRLLLGKLSDIKGRKRIMSIGLLADSIATALYPGATTITNFSALKGIKEVSQNLIKTMNDAMIGDAFPRRIRDRMIARLGTVFPLSRAIAAITGFVLVSCFSVITGFYLASLSMFVAFIVFAVFYREEHFQAIRTYRLSLSNISRPLVVISLIGLANSLSFSMAYFPGFFILANSLGLTEANLFLMFLLTYIISSLFAWRTEGWIRKHGRETVLGASCMGFGLMTMAYAIAETTAVFFVALLGVAISFYVFTIAYKTLLLSSTRREHRGEQVGFSKMMTSFGNIAGPLAGGLWLRAASEF
jgi:MFS family permease